MEGLTYGDLLGSEERYVGKKTVRRISEYEGKEKR